MTVPVSLAPGVVPGEITTMFNVNLTQDGNKYTFEGTDSNNGRELKYVGTVDSTAMSLAVTVTMPKNDLLGTWNLAKQDMATGKSPIILSWISTSPGITIPGIIDEPWPTKDAAALLGNLVLPSMLAKYLHTVTFQEDGNIVASYSSAGKEGESAISPANLAQYYIKDSKLYLQLNIDMILATVAANKTKTKALDASVILQFASLLSEGIPLNCEVKDGAAAIYADKDLILPLLSLLSSEDIVGLIIAQVPAAQQDMLKAVFAQLPELIKTTTEFNAGLNLEK